MKEEIRDLWVDALLSDEYPQGREQLKTPEGKFCCLGVLTDLAVKAGVCEWEGEGLGLGGFGVRDFIDNNKALSFLNATTLSDSVKKWAGLEDVDNSPYVTVNGKSYSLIELNDGEAYPFSKIAPLIKEQL